MGYAAVIPKKLNFRKLRNCDFQRFANTPEACITGPLRHFSDLFQKVAPVGITVASCTSIGLSHNLGDDVQVTNGIQKSGEFTKWLVHSDLLQMRLGQTFWIFFVFRSRSLE